VAWRPHHHREGRWLVPLCARVPRKPDISSADAFKRSMLAARIRITYPDPAGGGASGILHGPACLERLGIAGEMKPQDYAISICESAVRKALPAADVEIGIQSNQRSLGSTNPSNSLARCPSAIQNYTQFAPGIVTGSSQTDAGRALVTFPFLACRPDRSKSKGVRIKARCGVPQGSPPLATIP